MTKIYNSILLEKANIQFWYILTFANGILFCFFTESNKIAILLIFIILMLLDITSILLFNQFKKNFKIIFLFLTMFIFGYCVAFIKYNKVEYNTFKTPEYNISFSGIVEDIKLSSNNNIFILKIISSPNTLLLNKKVRIKADNKLIQNLNIELNDTLQINTSLIPIKYSNFPQDKSYENYAKFFEIIATGTAKQIEKIANNQNIKPNNSFKIFNISKKRNQIQQRIYEVNNKTPGAGIVISVLTGNNNFIQKKQLQNIRHSGCAHILAISGLHMSIIVSFVFFIFTHLFALFPNIALKYNTKKIAIIPAIITCFFYINIANIPISALRSFLMVLIASLTMLLNRKNSSLNTLFVTFLTILIISPNYILSPSFQMSFMAVFGLTTLYNSSIITETALFSYKKTTFHYIIGIFLSSIIATISTLFFEIYHFKQYAWIGLISNIPVIPLTEFLVLPFGFVGMIFNGTVIGDFFYLISGFFANIICLITDFTANLPHSFLLSKQMSDKQLYLIISGIICLFLAYSKFIKLFGMLLIIIGLFLYFNEPKYVLIYNQNLKNIVFFENNQYYSYQPINSEYIKSIWSQNLGVNEIIASTNENSALKCKIDNEFKDTLCSYKFKNKTYNFFKEKNNKIIGVKFKNGKFIEY